MWSQQIETSCDKPRIKFKKISHDIRLTKCYIVMHVCKLYSLCDRHWVKHSVMWPVARSTVSSSKKCTYTPLWHLSDGTCSHAPSPADVVVTCQSDARQILLVTGQDSSSELLGASNSWDMTSGPEFHERGAAMCPTSHLCDFTQPTRYHVINVVGKILI